MTHRFNLALHELTPTQLQAVCWDKGPAMVLAGPGVGKTTILTHRIARLLHESPKRHFRILALTYTTKAGDEMRKRVEELAPELVDRIFIGTFHAFCTQLLRQHGSHLGIKPDFGIYVLDEDRKELLRDALAGVEGTKPDDVRWLEVIDQLRRKLITPEKVMSHYRNPTTSARVSKTYEIYERALESHNVLDFDGMVINTCRLAKNVPAVAARIRRSYPYWLIDEFQDTLPAQYRLLQLLAGNEFQNIFAVADEDQIIYQWAGASYQRIVNFRKQFSPQIFQIIENRRCPQEVINAANNLVAHNTERTEKKERLVSPRPPQAGTICIKSFANDLEEAKGVAVEIGRLAPSDRGQVMILGRTRAVLKPVLDSLQDNGIKAAISQRREHFVSPQFVWLQACLELTLRPSDRLVTTRLVNAANQIAKCEHDAALIIAEASAPGRSYMEQWANEVGRSNGTTEKRLSRLAMMLVESRASWKLVVNEVLEWFSPTKATKDENVLDTWEDRQAWDEATRSARINSGKHYDLPLLVQNLALRPKEPTHDPQTVRLSTIHAAKGLETKYVWIVGMAEGILPSWQSTKPDAHISALEEERRNCFVAITRTQNALVLSHAQKYGKWNRLPSRFLGEMGFPAQ